MSADFLYVFCHGRSATHMLPLVSVTEPFAPLGRLQQLWARLTTHIPTEPTVTGGEHTTLGLSAAGALLFVSPWQVCCGADSIGRSVQSSLDGFMKVHFQHFIPHIHGQRFMSPNMRTVTSCLIELAWWLQRALLLLCG
jgi:hypothetical protein